MNLGTLNARHIGLIALHWSWYSVRGGAGLVYLMIALIFGLTVAHALIMPVEQLIGMQKRETGRMDPDAVHSLIATVGKPIIQFVLGTRSMEALGGPDNTAIGPGPGRPLPDVPVEPRDAQLSAWTSYLLETRPALLSAIFLVLLFGMPFAISFLAFNQVTGDIQSHGLRYLLLRTERGNIYFGRFLGTAAFSTAVMAILIGTITLYLGLRVRIYTTGALTAWALRGFLALSFLIALHSGVLDHLSVGGLAVPGTGADETDLRRRGCFCRPGRSQVGGDQLVRYALPWGGRTISCIRTRITGWRRAWPAAVHGGVPDAGYVRFETRELRCDDDTGGAPLKDYRSISGKSGPERSLVRRARPLDLRTARSQWGGKDPPLLDRRQLPEAGAGTIEVLGIDTRYIPACAGGCNLPQTPISSATSRSGPTGLLPPTGRTHEGAGREEVLRTLDGSACNRSPGDGWAACPTAWSSGSASLRRFWATRR